MAEPLEEVDFDGDVYLLVGPEGSQVRPKVSSTLLAIASPYFKTLFGPRFKEGPESAAGKDIELKHDDPRAFKLLCEILHMRYELTGSALTADELLEFAIVADKYDCTRPVALVLKTLFPDTPTGSMSFIDVGKLASAAYLLNHPQLFQQLTEDITRFFTDDFLDFVTLPCGQHMPAIAWGERFICYTFDIVADSSSYGRASALKRPRRIGEVFDAGWQREMRFGDVQRLQHVIRAACKETAGFGYASSGPEPSEHFQPLRKAVLQVLSQEEPSGHKDLLLPLFTTAVGRRSLQDHNKGAR